MSFFYIRSYLNYNRTKLLKQINDYDGMLHLFTETLVFVRISTEFYAPLPCHLRFPIMTALF